VRFTVAIDGPAASGKGTIARAVAGHFGFAHLDTGLLYRAVGMKTLDACRGVVDPVWAEGAAAHLTGADLARDDLRGSIAAQAASKVAVIPGVRAALLKFQRDFARRQGGAVLDGRDIGSVVCPQAEAKLFVTASEETRAHRRWLELGGEESDVLADLRIRDKRDLERATAPLVAAPDAVTLDTTSKSIEQAIAEAVAVVEERLGRR
jgi:CMP/dCMP kinase